MILQLIGEGNSDHINVLGFVTVIVSTFEFTVGLKWCKQTQRRYLSLQNWILSRVLSSKLKGVPADIDQSVLAADKVSFIWREHFGYKNNTPIERDVLGYKLTTYIVRSNSGQTNVPQRCQIGKVFLKFRGGNRIYNGDLLRRTFSWNKRKLS